jgi:hypothetical protein
MFISDQCAGEPLNNGYFFAAFEAMDEYHTQCWPFRLAVDFVRAFGAH